MNEPSSAAGTAADEVVEFCRDLIRLDTTNTGDTETSAGERTAAEYVAAKLAEVGLDPVMRESAKGRTSVVARIAGGDQRDNSAGGDQRDNSAGGVQRDNSAGGDQRDNSAGGDQRDESRGVASAEAEPQRGALLVHGHLDVVPADPDEWSLHPFSGEIKDGYVWGRGAVDMKDFDAMMLAAVRQMRREGRTPPRDLVLAFLADEEAGGQYGGHWLVDNHADLFEGCTEAIGEVGGFSYTVSENLRLYLIETAEKGLTWLRLHARGRPGHGSMINDDNAVTALAEAVARVGRHRFPVVMTDSVRAFLTEVSDALGTELDPDAPEDAIAKLGMIAPIIGSTIRNTANPTRLAAGYKENVIPSRATATIDCRTVPGQHEAFLDQFRAVVGPDLDIEVVQRQPPLETAFDGDLVTAMGAALRAEDPGARPVPYMLSGGTDAKAFARLGIRCFGFTPLRLPPELNFAALFHGIDERVPVEGLQFGVRVLNRLLSTC